MKKIEMIIAILSMLGVGLNLVFMPDNHSLVILPISTLSLLYFFLGFALLNDIELGNIFKKDSYKNIGFLRILGSVVTGYMLSGVTTGLIFKFLLFPGADEMLTGSLVLLLIITTIAAITYSKKQSSYYANIFKRAAILEIIGFTLLIL